MKEYQTKEENMKNATLINIIRNSAFWPSLAVNAVGVFLGGMLISFGLLWSIWPVGFDDGEKPDVIRFLQINHIFKGLLDGRWILALGIFGVVSSLIAVIPTVSNRIVLKVFAITLS